MYHGGGRERRPGEASVRVADIEAFLRGNGHYGPFEDGSASCYVCGAGIVRPADIGVFLVEKRREGEPEIRLERTFLDKMLLRDGAKVEVSIKYTCGSLRCVSDMRSSFYRQ